MPRLSLVLVLVFPISNPAAGSWLSPLSRTFGPFHPDQGWPLFKVGPRGRGRCLDGLRRPAYDVNMWTLAITAHQLWPFYLLAVVAALALIAAVVIWWTDLP